VESGEDRWVGCGSHPRPFGKIKNVSPNGRVVPRFRTAARGQGFPPAGARVKMI